MAFICLSFLLRAFVYFCPLHCILNFVQDEKGERELGNVEDDEGSEIIRREKVHKGKR